MSRSNYSRITILQLTAAALIALQVASCGSPEVRAQNYYESGKKFLASHEDAKAAVQFRNALRLKKDLLPAWQGLAQALEDLHDWADLVPVLQNALDLNPKDETTRMKLANLLLGGGAVKQADKLISEMPESDANNPTLLALKAVISYKLKDHDKAVGYAQSALKIEPGNVNALVVLAADRLDNNDPNGALQLLTSNPQAQDKDLGTELFRLKIYQQLKDSVHVEAQLKALVEQYPQNVPFRRDLVAIYLAQHQPDDAEKELRAIVTADRKNSQAGLDLIRFLYTTKGPAAARQELNDRIKAGGDVFPYQLALAEFDFDQGQVDDSFKLLNTLSDSTVATQAAAAQVMLAQLNFRNKKFDVAEKIINGVLSNDQGNVEALTLRATIRMDQGNLTGAIEDLRAALNDQPRSPNLMLMLASAYERSGTIDLADKEFADAMKVSKFNPVVGLDYASFLRRRGGNDRAYDVLSELATRWPDNVQVLSALAEMKLSRQDWAGAQQIAETIKRLGHADVLSDQILGAALGGQRKYGASISAFQDAVAAAPSSPQPMANLISAMINAKQSDKAVAFLQAALKGDANNAEAHVLLGNIDLSNNAPDQAEQEYKAAISGQPKDELGYQALANLYVRQKKTDAAMAVVQAGLKEKPDSGGLQLTQAGILELEGNYDQAISAYEDLRKKQPQSLVVINNLASLLSDHRTDKASLEEAESLAASLQDSQIAQFKDTLGWVYNRQGDFKASAPLLEEAANSLSNSALVHYHLGMTYIGLGQIAKATDQLKKALGETADDDLQTKIKAALKTVNTQ